MSEWQPASTAPTDETQSFFLWNGNSVQLGSSWESGFIDFWMDWMDPQPTHWMPITLPEPPC